LEGIAPLGQLNVQFFQALVLDLRRMPLGARQDIAETCEAAIDVLLYVIQVLLYVLYILQALVIPGLFAQA